MKCAPGLWTKSIILDAQRSRTNIQKQKVIISRTSTNRVGTLFGVKKAEAVCGTSHDQIIKTTIDLNREKPYQWITRCAQTADSFMSLIRVSQISSHYSCNTSSSTLTPAWTSPITATLTNESIRADFNIAYFSHFTPYIEISSPGRPICYVSWEKGAKVPALPEYA